MAQLLYNRGIVDPARIELFLSGDARLACDPLLLPGMEAAVSRLYRALLSGEKIAVYGDFDVDGITSTALMVESRMKSVRSPLTSMSWTVFTVPLCLPAVKPRVWVLLPWEHPAMFSTSIL